MSSRAAILGFALATAACAAGTTTAPSQHSLRFEVSPSNGTAVVRGARISVVVKVLDVPEEVGSVVVVMGVRFRRPDGVNDNSYLPGVPVATPPAGWMNHLPTTITSQFEVPLGTPTGNSFIPPGSHVTAITATLTTQDSAFHSETGVIAEYPVVDGS